MDSVIVHYGELALKGGNRDFFEQKLIDNIREKLNKRDYIAVKRFYGRILVNLREGASKKRVTTSLLRVFGIENFAFAFKSKQNIDQLAKDVFEKLPTMKAETFAVKTHRGNKNLFFTSLDVNKAVSAHLIQNGFEAKVKLNEPSLTVHIELFDNQAYFYFEKIAALGGMPTGTAGKVVCLLSSGFDSPVAAFKIMRRGAKCVFVHFHSYPYTNKASQDNVYEIVKILEKYQGKSNIHMISFANIQKQIMIKAPSRLRVILYRRYMIRIAEEIARKEKADALVTGDSLAQVASQTLKNIRVVSEVTALPILRPLIGMDKKEIIEISRLLQMYTICSRPYDDCCSMFTPKNPETHARLADIKKAEGQLVNLELS